MTEYRDLAMKGGITSWVVYPTLPSVCADSCASDRRILMATDNSEPEAAYPGPVEKAPDTGEATAQA